MPLRLTRSRIAALTLAGVTAAITGAVQATPGSATPASHTIHVIEHALTDLEIPTGGGKDVKGNTLTFNNPIFNAANRSRVGRDEGYCTRLEPKLGIWECQWTTFLSRGQITVQGPYYDTRNSVLSITGGTGAYRATRGQMQLLARAHGTQYDFVFQLS